MRRGEVWWVDYGTPVGSEAGYRRPAVIVQADALNKSQLGTVLLVPLTRTLKWAAAPGNVSCRARDTGLKHRSVANVSQLTATARRRLQEKAGRLPGAVMAQLDEGLKLVLGMSG